MKGPERRSTEPNIKLLNHSGTIKLDNEVKVSWDENDPRQIKLGLPDSETSIIIDVGDKQIYNIAGDVYGIIAGVSDVRIVLANDGDFWQSFSLRVGQDGEGGIIIKASSSLSLFDKRNKDKLLPDKVDALICQKRGEVNFRLEPVDFARAHGQIIDGHTPWRLLAV